MHNYDLNVDIDFITHNFLPAMCCHRRFSL